MIVAMISDKNKKFSLRINTTIHCFLAKKSFTKNILPQTNNFTHDIFIKSPCPSATTAIRELIPTGIVHLNPLVRTRNACLIANCLNLSAAVPIPSRVRLTVGLQFIRFVDRSTAAVVFHFNSF